MKNLLVLLPIVFLVASCSPPTDAEIAEQKKLCDLQGQDIAISSSPHYDMWCRYRTDPVFECIQRYNDGIDEKYNNPDTVSNLSEEDYSQVVKTCNEVFGKK